MLNLSESQCPLENSTMVLYLWRRPGWEKIIQVKACLDKEFIFPFLCLRSEDLTSYLLETSFHNIN